MTTRRAPRASTSLNAPSTISASDCSRHGGLELAGGQPILRPQEMADEQRRTRVITERAVRIERPHRSEIRREQRAGLRRERGVEQAGDAVPPFAGTPGFVGCEIVEAGAG